MASWFIVAVAVMSGAYWLNAGARPAVVQPIDFSHQKHLAIKLPCAMCHRFYAARQSSGRPGVAICAMCHAATAPKSPEMVKLRGFIDQKREIPWQRVYKVPEHVFYSHRTHVVDAKVECAVCHGAVEKQTAALTGPLKPISMDACMSCHRDRKVTNDCNACHK
ncbi:MAG: hypothetical protein HYZ11_01595 [Candidatus Tectomicrobia bacterium]|uniref:Cytochrome c7-like domain-containing protein n=1 Tax=Tectimicrobiota bacterium TaxID=2528274 RepID=A0A932HV77_UNCTE|nr:hypothetical protein [Candidatus Tectomicrobia bacterium]